MSYTAKTTYYFDEPGPGNTKDSASFAVERAEELGIKTIIVASTKGGSAEIFADAVKGTGVSLIVVTHVVGFSTPGVWEFPKSLADKLESEGVRVIKGTHVFSGLERAITRGGAKLGGASRTEAIAEALRKTVAVGLKVAVECTLIAADQGEIPVEDEIISVGGTISGSDTVCVIRPSHTSGYFDLQVREIVAMPRNR
ncbi:pyruvate kinase alpha/beta domain-containing protein [Methanoplanus endosymbiosus]|uniref:Pyruvate kinase C-terminal domain-containing protein n=1 Tax=Methanoplanus endosymbiosus TaxID=33865 RepID=A0A9E7PQ10_9EURY|nr:pyruvate kinase alpha/beta domain-containing protein [Methanoplanus endosymbiosus]UUX93880.1 hypothetical protein L6E24_10005 [Methanoplanus endosymbiosus]